MLETKMVESGEPVNSQYLDFGEHYTLGGTVVFRVRRVTREMAQK